ncbi:MAG: TlpA family protein disulfide reductase, partial [Hyphomicrobiales bacterium]|nr:TlpA family protein disulfide reductase [Hyphomicrobiales bacterium]
APRRESAGACPLSAARTKALAPLAKGQVAAFDVAAAPAKAPDLTFKDAGGGDVKLSSFAGRTVLLNLWATWCVPCRKELPALDALQKAAGSKSFEVVALNLDTTRLERIKPFLASIKIESLAYYADPTADALQSMKAVGSLPGLPTTFLIGPDGCVEGQLSGPAEWASPDARALIAAAL